MSNPSLLLCDADALIQIFLVDQTKLLRSLYTCYGVQPIIVFEVENELRQHKKYRTKIDPQFDKALRSESVKLFDMMCLQNFIRTSECFPPMPTAGATWDSIQGIGQQYAVKTGLGEAYTHATAVMLGVPSLSNDSRAVGTLDNFDLALPKPVLRTFDLLTLFYQIGHLTLKDCEQIRKLLLQSGESVPQNFQHTSFEDGVKGFCSRVLDRTVTAVGADPGSHAKGFASQLLLEPIV